MTKFANVFVGATLSGMLAISATAQDYPSGNITFIVPFSPGGGTDLASRILAERLASENGWTFVIDNRPGAGGNIGIAQVASSSPDGLTLGMGQTSNLAINPSLYGDLPYDPETDFTPIAIINAQPTVIAVHPDSPFETLDDLVAAAQADPEAVSMATPGSGTVAHLTLEYFGTVADADFLHIPYPGATQAMTDAIGGHVDFATGSLPSALSHLRAGTLRPLAVTSAERNEAIPDVPTVSELGYEDFVAGDWKAVVGPAGMDPEIVATLNEAINQALQDEDLLEAFAADGSEVVGGTPEDLAALMSSEFIRWTEIIEISGATPE